MLRKHLANLLVAAFAGLAGLAGSYAIAGFTPDFIAGPIAGFMARQIPAVVITFAIVVLGDLGHQLNLVGALAIAAGGLGVIAYGGLVLEDRLDRRFVAPVVAAVGGAVLAISITRAPLASISTGLATGIVVAVAESATVVPVKGTSAGRRRVIGGTGSALVFAVTGFLLGSRGDPHGATMNADLDLDDRTNEMAVSELLAEADEKSLAVDGLEPLVSDDFYEVDINATDPTVDADEWELTVTGAVTEQVGYTYDDIRAMPREHHFNTLRCVGESLNGKKLDNAVWTGVPIMDILEPAGVSDTCCVMLRAADGFFEQFPLAALRNGILAYGMNSQVLPRAHGYPARALIPGHWGEVNVKWLTEIEILEEEEEGYWEKRGWHGTGPVNTVAKLHVENRLEDGLIEVAGHAYAGTRGIQAVEVSTDGGESWSPATLSEPLPGDDVWRQWVYRYDPPNRAHEVVVRATDASGTLQPRQAAESFPNGPSGWVSKEIRP